MATEHTEQLMHLREQVLNELLSYSDKLMSSDDVGYDTLLSIGHMTENPEMLQKALEKIHAIPDEEARTNALLELLNEVEFQLAPPIVLEDAEPATDAEATEEQDEVFLPQPAPEQQGEQQ